MHGQQNIYKKINGNVGSAEWTFTSVRYKMIQEMIHSDVTQRWARHVKLQSGKRQETDRLVMTVMA